MKFLKALLYGLCFLLFACLFVSFGIYLANIAQNVISDNNYETPTITLNVGTGDRSINQMPTLETISLSFPQFWIDSKLSNKHIPDCSLNSNITTKVEAINPIDPDGNISRIKFYYYDTANPEKIEYKESWIFSPFAYFVVPMGGEYKFGVILYDNNGGIVDSKDIIGQPSIYLPKTCE